MHPILAQKRRLGLYLAGWLPIAGLIAAVVAFTGRLSWSDALALALPMALEYAFLCLAAWYLCRVFPLQRTGIIRLIGVHSVAALLSSSLWILSGQVWVILLSRGRHFAGLDRRYAAQIPVLFGIGVLLFFLAVAVHYLMVTFEITRESERRALELRILAREAELKALKAQIDPHFLFNSLNSVSALIPTNQAAARKMCQLLADFLRKSLSLGRQESISLAEEAALAANFLAIEEVRFGSRLKTEFCIDRACENCLVPPLLLQPLVENAVKHGIAQLLEGGIVRIEARQLGETLTVAVENSCDPERPAAGGKGLGLENVRGRLTTLYGLEARVDFNSTAGLFRVELSLPARLGPEDSKATRNRLSSEIEFV